MTGRNNAVAIVQLPLLLAVMATRGVEPGGDVNMSKQNLKTQLSLPEDGITAGAV